jgi:hypothetical protein
MLRALTCARGKQQQQIELGGMKMININTSEEKVLMELSDNNNLIRNIQCCGFFEGVNLCRIWRGNLKIVLKVNRSNAEWRCDQLVEIVGLRMHQIQTWQSNISASFELSFDSKLP